MERVSDNIRKWSSLLKNIGLFCCWVYNLLVSVVNGEPILFIIGILSAALTTVAILLVYYLALGLAEIVDNTESTKIDLSKIRSSLDNGDYNNRD